ncbi:MAG: HAD family hydrolase [Candidatus Sericytochromatia bacterium]|nr:HAD family hydrolase [Candidatus Tanganyikabacteria bacterium]
MKPAVFLDRDGTINEEVGYIRNLADMRLIPGAGEAIRRLNEQDVPVVLVTNQSGPARGYYPEDWVRTLHDRLQELLLEEGAILDEVRYCPHLPPDEGGVVPQYARVCDCRKPGIAMVRQAAEERGYDLRRSYVVGDKASDVELGHRAGTRTILLQTGYGNDVLAGRYQWQVRADHVAPDLSRAVDWILQDLVRPVGPSEVY